MRTWAYAAAAFTVAFVGIPLYVYLPELHHIAVVGWILVGWLLIPARLPPERRARRGEADGCARSANSGRRGS